MAKASAERQKELNENLTEQYKYIPILADDATTRVLEFEEYSNFSALNNQRLCTKLIAFNESPSYKLSLTPQEHKKRVAEYSRPNLEEIGAWLEAQSKNINK